MLDSCGVYGTKKTTPELLDVGLHYLPSDITSLLQSMDADIILKFKKPYRKLQCERSLDALDDVPANIYKLYQMVAIKFVRSIWNTF